MSTGIASPHHRIAVGWVERSDTHHRRIAIDNNQTRP